MINRLAALKRQIKQNRPLIHCITNPISINDCANAVLALGARPIMAEHPKEVCAITKTAQALAVNLGNITDARMESILLAGETAAAQHIPHIIDAVGVTCSPLRMELARDYIRECKPWIIKGNSSEIKALAGGTVCASGIDAADGDKVTPGNLAVWADLAKNYALETGAVILATGKIDLICTAEKAYAVQNGCVMLSELTGTGCMLNVITASFLAGKDALAAAVLGAAVLGIAGELAQTPKGTGTFRQNLLDALYTMTEDTLREKMNIGAIQ